MGPGHLKDLFWQIVTQGRWTLLRKLRYHGTRTRTAWPTFALLSLAPVSLSLFDAKHPTVCLPYSTSPSHPLPVIEVSAWVCADSGTVTSQGWVPGSRYWIRVPWTSGCPAATHGSWHQFGRLWEPWGWWLGWDCWPECLSLGISQCGASVPRERVPKGSIWTARFSIGWSRREPAQIQGEGTQIPSFSPSMRSGQNLCGSLKSYYRWLLNEMGCKIAEYLVCTCVSVMCVYIFWFMI